MHNEALVQKLIASVSLFQDFTPDEARDFLSHCRVEAHPAGKRLVQEGQPGRTLFVLLSGVVAIKRFSGVCEHELAQLGPGETFGELALLDYGERSASVEAVEAVRVLVYDRDGMLWTHPEAAKLYRNLAVMLASRLRETDVRMAELAETLAEHAAFARLNRST